MAIAIAVACLTSVLLIGSGRGLALEMISLAVVMVFRKHEIQHT